MFMKRTLMAAAIAALAVSGAANAAMTTTSSGNSSLILTLLDTTDGVSATFDLGYDKSTFNQLANSSWNVNLGDYASAWSSFWSVATAGNTQYAVFAGDSSGAAVGDQSIFTTLSAATWANTSGSTLNNMQAAFDTYINANNAMPNHNSVANGADFTTSTGPLNTYAGISAAYGGTGKIGNFGSDTNALVGTDMNVWNIVRASTNNLTAATATKLSVAGFNPYFNLSSTGSLVYVAAVPEPGEWALMLSGFGLIGFIAARRKNRNTSMTFA